MTNNQKKLYIERKGVRCPFCDSNMLKVVRSEPVDSDIEAGVSCAMCGQEWIDIYRLAAVETAAEREQQK